MIAEITRKITRRLSVSDLEAIASCVATMKLTEREACLHLGINPGQFASWKSKNKHTERFDSIIARIRASSIAGLVNKIQVAGDDYEIQLPNGKVITKRGDWRAPAFLLQNVIASDRFNPQVSTTPQVSTNVNIQVMHDTLKRIIDAEVVSTTDISAKDIKRLTCSTNVENESERSIKMPVRGK